MGPDQLGGVMEEITRNSAKRDGMMVEEEKLNVNVRAFKSNVQRDSDAYMTSAHLLDDGVIEPGDTRDVLGMCLDVVNIEAVDGNPSFRGLARM